MKEEIPLESILPVSKVESPFPVFQAKYEEIIFNSEHLLTPNKVCNYPIHMYLIKKLSKLNMIVI